VFSAYETQSLIGACDCFVSLHRAEGFGRGLGEAMAMGKLALGTGWSGNLDFMSDADSLPVRYTLRPLEEGEYPDWEGQSWAEPDIDHAVALVDAVRRDPARQRALTQAARTAALTRSGNRAVGVRMLQRMRAIGERPSVADVSTVAAQ